MLKLSEFSVKDWLKLRPLDVAFKQVRNDIWLKYYVKQKPAELSQFLADNRHLAGKNIAIVVAFEQPWAVNWLLQMAKKNLINTTVLVFDNSHNASARAELAAVCKQNGAPYLALPMNKTKHVNRSHGMAMSWIYDNVVRAIEPKIFAYIDHDLIPVSPIDFEERLANQPFFGRAGGKLPQYWSLWAGYCIFDFAFTKNKLLNFLYDFSRLLDTGGRNWDILYSKFDKSKIRFANREFKNISLPSFEASKLVEIVDDCWVHIGSISYNDNFRSKFDFFQGLADAVSENANWTRLVNTANN
jgi:hypothetical protein